MLVKKLSVDLPIQKKNLAFLLAMLESMKIKLLWRCTLCGFASTTVLQQTLNCSVPTRMTRLFQEARKIVIAELQHITYNEWLPVLFPSKELRKQFGVLLKPKGKFFTGYDPEVNVQCTNVFSTSALRMGHSLIRAVFDLRSA
ncbi:unnamed protein product, partial [Porites lobata]